MQEDSFIFSNKNNSNNSELSEKTTEKEELIYFFGKEKYNEECVIFKTTNTYKQTNNKNNDYLTSNPFIVKKEELVNLIQFFQNKKNKNYFNNVSPSEIDLKPLFE